MILKFTFVCAIEGHEPHIIDFGQDALWGNISSFNYITECTIPEGYRRDLYYDSAFTMPIDFNARLTNNLTLYEKEYVSLKECNVTFMCGVNGHAPHIITTEKIFLKTMISNIDVTDTKMQRIIT